MRVPGIARARRDLRAVKNLLRLHGVILMYHRIAQADHDPWFLCVSPERFAEQLEFLSRCADVVPLQRLFEAIRAGRRSRPPVAITFDDGYADNLYNAKPLLERHSMPATVFVASGYTRARRAFWSDELVRIVLGTVTLPDQLALTIGGAPFEWISAASERKDATNGFEEQSANGDRCLERQALLLALWRKLRPLSTREQMCLLDELRRWARCQDAPDPATRPLTCAEVTRLADGGLIEIGAHTMSHCELPALSTDGQMGEIMGSKAACEAIIDRPVMSFAYPYGRFDETSVDCVRQSGFTFACTTRPGLSLTGTDRLLLPRLAVRDWNGGEFERRFRRRFDPDKYAA